MLIRAPQTTPLIRPFPLNFDDNYSDRLRLVIDRVSSLSSVLIWHSRRLCKTAIKN